MPLQTVLTARSSRDPWLILILALSTALGFFQIDWGLPNGNTSWAADALGPLTVLNIARRSFTSWNSGWFYFKYPLGYPLLLLALYTPYLGLLLLTGHWRHPTSTYPFGFADPEGALYTMALLGRLLSVALVVATVGLTYGIGRRVLGRSAARFAAFFVATAYPVVYYAHTTNLDAAYLFWLTLGLWATVVAAATPARWPYVIVGVAAAMAMSTKEQGYAFLLSLAVILAVSAYRALPPQLGLVRRAWQAVWNPGTRAGLLAAVITLVVAGNVLINPLGLLNRVRNLGGYQVEGVTARFTPLKFALYKGLAKEQQYIRQFADALESSFGLPLLVVAAAGAVYILRAQPRAALYVLLPAAAYYFVSLRTHDLIQLRYALPMIVLGGLCAGAACATLVVARLRLAGIVVAALCVLSLARAVELDLLLGQDSRYAAEEWIRLSMTPTTTVEAYQKPVYLPRLRSVDAYTVPLGERSIAGLRQRAPEFIITSSAARKGMTHRWNPDWRQGNTLLVEAPEAAAMVQGLEDGTLPYRRVALFEQHPRLLRVRITSLCPTISIYRRVHE